MEDTLREWSVCKVGGYEEKKADGRSEGMAQSNEESQIRKKSNNFLIIKNRTQHVPQKSKQTGPAIHPNWEVLQAKDRTPAPIMAVMI